MGSDAGSIGTLPSTGWGRGSTRTTTGAPTGSSPSGRPVLRSVDRYRGTRVVETTDPTNTTPRGVAKGTPERTDQRATIRPGSGAGESAGTSPRGAAGSVRGALDPSATKGGTRGSTTGGVRYGAGPVGRPTAGDAVRPSGGSKTSPGVSGTSGRGNTGGASGATGGGRDVRGVASGGVRGTASSLAGLRDLRKTKPLEARRVEAAGAVLASARNVAHAASVRALGGVYATPYLGSGWYASASYGSYSPACYSPFGYWYYGGSYNWAFSFGWGSRWWWSSRCSAYYWPLYYTCWYPIWYTVYRPYSYDYGNTTYYQTVVYREAYETSNDAPAVVANDPAPSASETSSTVTDALAIAAERYLTLGDQAFRDERYTDAVQLYAKAVEFAPEDGSLYFVLADALFAAGDYHYAAYAIRKGVELDPTLVDGVVDKHEFYSDPRSFDQQLAKLELYLVEHPSDRDARLVFALNNLFGGRPAVAVDVLRTSDAASLAGDVSAERILAAAEARQYGQVGVERTESER